MYEINKAQRLWRKSYTTTNTDRPSEPQSYTKATSPYHRKYFSKDNCLAAACSKSCWHYPCYDTCGQGLLFQNNAQWDGSTKALAVKPDSVGSIPLTQLVEGKRGPTPVNCPCSLWHTLPCTNIHISKCKQKGNFKKPKPTESIFFILPLKHPPGAQGSVPGPPDPSCPAGQLYNLRPFPIARTLHVRRSHFWINSQPPKTGESFQPLLQALLRWQEPREPGPWLQLGIIYQNEVAFAVWHTNLFHR